MAARLMHLGEELIPVNLHCPILRGTGVPKISGTETGTLARLEVALQRQHRRCVELLRPVVSVLSLCVRKSDMMIFEMFDAVAYGTFLGYVDMADGAHLSASCRFLRKKNFSMFISSSSNGSSVDMTRMTF